MSKKNKYIVHVYSTDAKEFVSTHELECTFQELESFGSKQFARKNVYKVKAFYPPGPRRPGDPNDPNLIFEMV